MDTISFDFRTSPHLLLSGGSGSGKSYLLRYLLEMFAYSGEVILIDSKLSDGARWAKKYLEDNKNLELIIPEFSNIQNDSYDTSGLGDSFLKKVNSRLTSIESELYRRQSNLFNKSEKISTDFKELSYEQIVIVIDELVALLSNATKPVKEKFFGLLTRISTLGRESGIFLCISLQSAKAEYIPSIVRDQMSVRILLGRIDKTTIQYTFPEMTESLFIPLGGKGTGIISIQGDYNYSGIEPLATPTILER